MPIYEVQAPDGSILEIQGPENASDAELINTAALYVRQQEFAKQAPPPEPVAAPKRAEDVGFFEGLGAAGRRGIESLGDVAAGLGLAGTSLTGTEEETRRKMQAIRAEQRKPQETPGTTFADLERIYKEKGLMSALGEVPKYAGEQILQSAPQMAAPLAAGAAASPFITPVGGALVGMGTYAVQQFGNFLVRQAVEKDDPKELEVAKAAMTAAGTAPIGYFADRFTFGLGSVGKSAGKEIVEELGARGIGALAGKVSKGAVTGVIAEAPTEVLEQAAERWQAGLDLTSPEAQNEYKEAFFGAAAAGGGIKGVSSAIDYYKGAPTPEQPGAELPPNILPPAEGAPPTEGEGPGIRGLEETNPPIGVPPEEFEPPVTEAPPVEPPVTEAPPVETTPPVEPPVVETPPVQPPIETPPVEPIPAVETTPPVEPPIGEPPVVETPPVEGAPPVEPPAVEPGSIYHPFEIAMQSGNQEEIAKINEAGKLTGIHFNFNDEGRINLDGTKVDWGVLKKLNTGKKVLDHIRDYVPLDTREIIDRISPYVKDIPIKVSNANSKNYGLHHLYGFGTDARHNINLYAKTSKGNSVETIVHELVHGATVRNYYEGRYYNESQKNGFGIPGDVKFSKASKELEALTAYLQKNHAKDISFFKSYKKTIEEVAPELLTWGTTNRKAQEELKKIKLPDGSSVWSKFVGIMRNLLQIPANETNALTRILELQDSLIGGKPAKPYAKPRVRRGSSQSVITAARDMALSEEEPIANASMAPRTKATGGAAPEATWGLRPLEAETSTSRYLKNKVYEYVDKFVDLKDIIKAINAGSKKLDETWNAYRRETLYHNRVAWMTNQFLKNDLKPLAEDMVKRNVSEEELNNYLLARHAEDYNSRINERNPAVHLQDRGSGVHTMIARAFMKGANAQQIQAIRDLFAKNNLEINSNEEALLKDLAKMSDAKRNNLAEVAKRIDKIVKETQKISVAGGLEKQSTIDFWRDMYPNYVPLKRSPEELDFVEKNYGTGRGFSTKSGFGRAATGSLKTVDNIMANLILQRDMAIVRSEKGRIGRALYAMALQNPNPSFWLPVNPEAAAISKANDLYVQIAKDKESLQRKIEKADADLANGKDVDPADLAEIDEMRKKLSRDEAKHAELAAKAEQVKKSIVEELGKLEGAHGLTPDAIDNLIREPQGAWYNPATRQVEYRTNAYLRSSPNVLAVPVDGETRYIFFNPGDERASRLVKSLKSADVEQLGEITSAVGKATRWIAKVNTQYNPFFGIVNMMRDIQGAQFSLSSTPLAGRQVAVDKNIPGAMATIYRSLRAERGGKEAVGPYAADWAEFQKLGGPTGIKDMLAREQDKLSVLGEEISKLQEGTAKKMGRRGFNAVFDLMSDFNDTMENSVRLAAFVEAKKKFKSQGFNDSVAADKAAELAKNLTVNFNRKGAKSQMVNSWFAFFNAAVQGSARLVETMKGPAGKKIMASLVMLGVIQQLWLASAEFDDEDPPEFVRAKNFVIPTGGGKYLSVPMPLGFNAFVNFGRIITAAGMDGGKHKAKYMGDMVGMLSDSFNPFGSSGLSAQTITPTVADPLVALGENRDAFGRPIYREDRANKPTPGYLRSSETSSEISKFISKTINQLTGGTDYQKGYLSPTADEIDYLAGQVGGGSYREAKKVGEFVQSQVTGEEVAPYKVPLAGRFMGDTGSDANARSKFYQNVTQLSKYEDEIKGRAKNHQDIQAFLKEHPEARLYDAANSVENEVIQMNKMRKELIARGASKEQLKRLNDMKIQRMRQFNQMVDKATQQ